MLLLNIYYCDILKTKSKRISIQLIVSFALPLKLDIVL